MDRTETSPARGVLLDKALVSAMRSFSSPLRQGFKNHVLGNSRILRFVQQAREVSWVSSRGAELKNKSVAHKIFRGK